jgi:class 3 adenylate cyclase/tetratricopeptide (TPR) repeat protein
VICVACGTPLSDGSRFCSECGATQVTACSACGTELAAQAKFCSQCGTATAGSAVPSRSTGAASDLSTPVSERRVTSVLFGDLVGFTTLSESRDPEEVRELLTRYFDTARDIVARYGGTIEKFIGDAVMAVWGVPTTHEDDAERAVRAGIDLTEAIAAFGEDVGAPGLAMRVGVVTGEVAATVGATGQGMVAGDAVNTAARVQSKADPGTVWVDAQTRALVQGAVDFVPAGTHELKGKAAPVELFRAMSVIAGIGGDARSGDKVQAPLVGRRRELGVLKELFHAAAEEGRPRLIVVSGDAGIGKSRLATEFENYLDGLSADVLWHRGRCLSYGDGVAFSALTAAVRGRIGATDDDAESVVQDKLRRSLDTYVPDSTERGRLLTALVNLLGLSGADGGMTRQDLFSAWLSWFQLLSQLEGDPVVWVIDDAQYADDGLLDFIELLATVADLPVLVVVLARPDLLARRRPTLASLRRVTVVNLETLARSDTESLLDQLVEGLPAELRDALAERAEGNPLFAIETVRAMHDHGLAVDGPTRRPGAKRLATGVDADALASLAAPASLQVLVSSRLDLLPTRERSVLAAASVLGQTFSRTALAAITDLSEDELTAALHELTDRDLVAAVTDRLSSEEGQHAFVQSVVRTIAYQTQAKRDRLERHLAVVDHWTPLAESDTVLSTVIAQHLRDAMELLGPSDPQRGELTSRLAQWLERSAQRSRAVGAPGDAMRALIEALGHVDDPHEQTRLRIEIAITGYDAGETDKAAEYGLSVVRDPDADRLDIARAAPVAALAMRDLGEMDESWALMEPYLDDGAMDGLPSSVASIIARRLATFLTFSGRAEEAVSWADRALFLAEGVDDPRLLVACITARATVDAYRGHLDVAVAIYELSVEVARREGLVTELGIALLCLAAGTMGKQPTEALAAADEAMTLFEQSGKAGSCWDLAINQAHLLTMTGQWDDLDAIGTRPLMREHPPQAFQSALIELSRAAIARARGEELDLTRLEELASLADGGDGDFLERLYFLGVRAGHAAATGDTATLVAAARQLVDEGERMTGFTDDMPFLWSFVVGWTIEAGEFAAARELVQPVLDLAAPRRGPFLAAELARLRWTLEVRDPASSAAPDLVENGLLEAIAQLDALGAAPARARAQAALGSWLTGQDRRGDAAPHLAAARAAFIELRADAWMRELDGAAPLAAAR